MTEIMPGMHVFDVHDVSSHGRGIGEVTATDPDNAYVIWANKDQGYVPKSELRIAVTRNEFLNELSKFSDDALIDELERRNVVPKKHLADITFGEYGMQHTIRCGKDKMACMYHIWLTDKFMANGGMSPFTPGVHEMSATPKGEITMKLIKERKGTL